MENIFIVRYRRALRELQEAYRLQYALVDESDALRTLAYQQAHTAEKAILKNHKRGRAFLISRLTECLDEEPHTWKVTQHIKREIEEMEANRYDSEISDEQNHALYLVIEDAIICLLAVLGSQYPKKLTAIDIPTSRGIIPASKLILKFGPVPLQRIVRQLLKAAADNPAAPATTEPQQPGSPPRDTLAPPNPTPNKIRFCNGFSSEKADRVAFEIELVDAKNNYIGLPGVAPGRLCGFYNQLKCKKLVSGSLENLRDYFAERYLKRRVSGKPDPKTYVAFDTATETQTALERLLLL